ncbi:MAG: LAGLIDADG family homing endonuclease [Nanoarchaeota archaeon]
MLNNNYKLHSLEEYNEVIALKKSGLNPTQIYSFLFNKGREIKYNTLYDWIYYNKKPFQEKIIHKIPEESKLLTKEKAYVLGVLCGDGYIRVHKSGYGFLVGLDVCDEDFADEFRNCLQVIYKLTPSKNLRKVKPTNYTNTPKPRFSINLTSKLVVKDLFRYAESFKTKEWTVPKEILDSNLEIKSAFIRGLFDSEGTISLRKSSGAYLSVCSGNINPLLNVREMLKKDFDIDLKPLYPQKDFIKLKSAKYQDIKNFSDKIGFTIGRKKQVLEIAVKNFKIKSKNETSKNKFERA